MRSSARLYALLLAILGGGSWLLQGWLSVQVAWAAGGSAASGLWTFVGYFTVLTNAFVVLALASVVLGPVNALARWLARADVHAALAMSIIVVGAIYNVLLRQLWHPHGWQLFADVVLHDVMPVAFVLWWWLAVPKEALRWADVLRWQAYPALYFAYVLLRGALDGRYPYPFLDVATLGYARVLVDAIGVLAVFMLVAAVLVALGRWQWRRMAGTAVSRA